MPDTATTPAEEIAAMRSITRLLDALDEPARRRVVDWTTDRHREDDHG